MKNNMPGGDQFWAIINSIFGLIIITLIISIATYNINTNKKISEAIKAGANPIDVAVAFDNIYTEKVMAAYMGQKIR